VSKDDKLAYFILFKPLVSNVLRINNKLKFPPIKLEFLFVNCYIKPNVIVTRKGVAEQGFYGCAFCVNARFTN
jgi:hypothetical protein